MRESTHERGNDETPADGEGLRPRIAIVRHSPYPDDMHIRRDAVALRDAGFEIDLICDYDPDQPLIDHVDGITILRIPPKHRRGGVGRYLFEYSVFPLIAGLVLALRGMRKRYQWIEINNLPDWLIVAAAVPKFLGSKVVLYSREDTARLLAADHDLSLSHPLIRLIGAIQRVCYRLADRIITTQEFARQDLLDHGFSPQRVVAIPNAPDERDFLARVGGISATVREPGSGLRLVTHGLLVKRYGVETLIEAVHILKDPVPDIHLEIIGDGEYRPALEAMVERLNLQEEITFTGYVSDYTMVAPMLQRADIGVVPIWTDFQLCNKLVDYLALGIPAVTTASAAVRPYLNDDCVLYVERKNPVALADALLSLFCDPDRRASLAAAGHSAYRQHLSWEGTRDTYLNVYSGAAHQPSNLTDCARGMDFSPGLMEGTWCTQE